MTSDNSDSESPSNSNKGSKGKTKKKVKMPDQNSPKVHKKDQIASEENQLLTQDNPNSYSEKGKAADQPYSYSAVAPIGPILNYPQQSGGYALQNNTQNYYNGSPEAFNQAPMPYNLPTGMAVVNFNYSPLPLQEESQGHDKPNSKDKNKKGANKKELNGKKEGDKSKNKEHKQSGNKVHPSGYQSEEYVHNEIYFYHIDVPGPYLNHGQPFSAKHRSTHDSDDDCCGIQCCIILSKCIHFYCFELCFILSRVLCYPIKLTLQLLQALNKLISNCCDVCCNGSCKFCCRLILSFSDSCLGFIAGCCQLLKQVGLFIFGPFLGIIRYISHSIESAIGYIFGGVSQIIKFCKCGEENFFKFIGRNVCNVIEFFPRLFSWICELISKLLQGSTEVCNAVFSCLGAACTSTCEAGCSIISSICEIWGSVCSGICSICN